MHDYATTKCTPRKATLKWKSYGVEVVVTKQESVELSKLIERLVKEQEDFSII